MFSRKARIGARASDFSLPSHLGGRVRLLDYRGKKQVLIAFYPLDWTPI
ncbi:MAG: redoxin domain-containing protein [Candidatus Zixiibacteriota bacterium]|nr:MAG: redoxin domain-containing protein [candidate division Zixibacteria bacterium]